MRFPVSRSTAAVAAELDLVELDDQTGNFELLRRTRLPSAILSSAEEELETGVLLFATQTTVWPGIFLYQIPM